ncbi:MAG: dethiobiotin synthase [Deltaproteobacteria bacterium]|nr:dethiobiotin synthase [Deltaproteobacteria bacterium]
MNRGLLVVGTDTGVGKTVISTLLLAVLRKRGARVAAFKPVETGCDPDPMDAIMLSEAAGASDPLDVVCPYRFRLPAAPEAAARAEGRTIDPDRLEECFAKLSAGGRFVLVEAAGGAGTPYAPDMLGLDLARLLDLPVLLVARAVLGTVGQTLVALHAVQSVGALCAGIVLSRVPGAVPGPEDPTNVPLIEAHAAPVPVLGVLPRLPEPAPSSIEDLAALIEDHVDVDRILR